MTVVTSRLKGPVEIDVMDNGYVLRWTVHRTSAYGERDYEQRLVFPFGERPSLLARLNLVLDDEVEQ
jgi:hypothetical protein